MTLAPTDSVSKKSIPHKCEKHPAAHRVINCVGILGLGCAALDFHPNLKGKLPVRQLLFSASIGRGMLGQGLLQGLATPTAAAVGLVRLGTEHIAAHPASSIALAGATVALIAVRRQG
jgi:hypothetical protein